MRKKVLESLKTKFPGVSDAILDVIATNKAKDITDESRIPGIIDGIGFQDVLNSWGDRRATEAVTASVKNYEEKHGIKDGKPIKKDDPDPQSSSKSEKTPLTPEEFDAYFERKMQGAIKPYQEKIERFEADKKKNDRQTLITGAMKELGLTEDEMSFVSVPEDKDPKEYLTSYKQHLVTKGLKSDKQEGVRTGDAAAQSEMAKLLLDKIAVPEAKI